MNKSKNELIWDSKDDDGRTVPSGVYFVRLKTETETATKKITIRR